MARLAGMAVMVGLRGRIERVVAHDDTAQALGSGDVPVLGTPRVLALAEAATVDALADALEPGQTSVGTEVSLRHLRASPIGAELVAEAELSKVDRRTLRFTVTVVQGAAPVADGVVERVIVDRERFVATATR